MVDVPAHEETVECTVEVPDRYAETTVVNGGLMPAGSLTGTYHTETSTYTEYVEEQGHYEQYNAGDIVTEEAYDYCSECGARR